MFKLQPSDDEVVLKYLRQEVIRGALAKAQFVVEDKLRSDEQKGDQTQQTNKAFICRLPADSPYS